MKKMILSLVAVLMFTACGEMKIDSSTNATYKESIENMKNNLPVEKSQKFTEALEHIFIVQTMKINDVPVYEVKKSMIRDGAIASAKKLNGNTADEVIKKGKVAKNKIECSSTDDMIELIHDSIDKISELKHIDTTEKIKEYEGKLKEKIDFHDKNCF